MWVRGRGRGRGRGRSRVRVRVSGGRLVVVVVELESVLELEAAREAGVAAPYEGLHLLAVAEQQHAPEI